MEYKMLHIPTGKIISQEFKAHQIVGYVSDALITKVSVLTAINEWNRLGNGKYVYWIEPSELAKARR